MQIKLSSADIIVVFDKFDSSSLSDLLIKSYVKSTNFSQIVDSFVVHNVTRYLYLKDTFYSYSSSVSITSDKDWLIQLSAAANTYKISDIHYSNDHEYAFLGEIKYICNDRTFYKLNGADSSIAAPAAAEDGMSVTAEIYLTP